MADCAVGQGLHLTKFEGPTQCLWATFPFFCLRMKKRGHKVTEALVSMVFPPGYLDTGQINKGWSNSQAHPEGPRPAPPFVPTCSQGAGDSSKSLGSTHQMDGGKQCGH